MRRLYKINVTAHNPGTYLNTVFAVSVSDRIRTIVQNVLPNAVKVSARGQELTVSEKRCARQVPSNIDYQGSCFKAAAHTRIVAAFGAASPQESVSKVLD